MARYDSTHGVATAAAPARGGNGGAARMAAVALLLGCSTSALFLHYRQPAPTEVSARVSAVSRLRSATATGGAPRAQQTFSDQDVLMFTSNLADGCPDQGNPAGENLSTCVVVHLAAVHSVMPARHPARARG